MKILSSFVLDFYKTINKTYVSQHEYYGLLSRSKILKYIRKSSCVIATYFPILILDLNALLLMMVVVVIEIFPTGDWKYFPTGGLSLLPVSGLVDGVPQRGGARPELVGVRAVGTLQVAARPLQTAAWP